LPSSNEAFRDFASIEKWEKYPGRKKNIAREKKNSQGEKNIAWEKKK